jgi:hypothetical protein
MKKCSPSHEELVLWQVLVPLFLRPLGVNRPLTGRMDDQTDGRMDDGTDECTLCLMHRFEPYA